MHCRSAVIIFSNVDTPVSVIPWSASTLYGLPSSAGRLAIPMTDRFEYVNTGIYSDMLLLFDSLLINAHDPLMTTFLRSKPTTAVSAVPCESDAYLECGGMPISNATLSTRWLE